MTHLILHKVRGEPAFDVACKLGEPDEEDPIWIIPTSGHRAYPYLTWKIDELVAGQGDGDRVVDFCDHDTVPQDWPDHYTIDNGSKPEPSFNIMAIISPMMSKFKRRL